MSQAQDYTHQIIQEIHDGIEQTGQHMRSLRLKLRLALWTLLAAGVIIVVLLLTVLSRS